MISPPLSPLSQPGSWAAADVDKRCLWHPFTQMRAWCAPGHDPLVLVRGKGVWLWDDRDRPYIDANSSIWTNIHGHNHPVINEAIRRQLGEVAHVSFLGFTHPTAIQLAEKLVGLWPQGTLTRVFYTDDGSTAMECALKMAWQYWRLRGDDKRTRFAAFDLAYHGDTCGTSSLGGIPAFHERFGPLHFPVSRFRTVDEIEALPRSEAECFAAVAIEPLIQGAAGMRLWPSGSLKRLRAWCDRNGVLLITDEVMTGFGRTGTMFASLHEDVVPDIVALAKGLTGGYLPLAATLAREEIFEAFLGEYADLKTFFYGHSYCANALGCAAALANIGLFESEKTLESLPAKVELLQRLLGALAENHPHVGGVRQLGLIGAIDVVRRRGETQVAMEPYPWQEAIGARVCVAARRHGLLTRPIGDTIVLMPPLVVDAAELYQCTAAISQAISDVCGTVA